ncbi:hypothetical protein Nepgr_000695 [Nepenthes gracilis]|uniref:Uncharacterized protein n=1 Tax=Nepenthes gracilis TaxID=150966 RepID=A0AAD3P3C9_NEPGR|nr:hypothetical protein Nepgr_000695 [Nepenthes gracilis]
MASANFMNWPSSPSTVVNDATIHPLPAAAPPDPCSQNCSSSPPFISRADEKMQRAAMKLRNAVDQVLPWSRIEKDKELENLQAGLARARVLIREAMQSGKKSYFFSYEDIDYVP